MSDFEVRDRRQGMTNEKYLQQARKLLGIGEFKRTPDIKTLEAILERESVQPIHIMPDGSLSDSAPVQAIAEALAEKDALLRECLPLIESVTFDGIGTALARRIRESLG